MNAPCEIICASQSSTRSTGASQLSPNGMDSPKSFQNGVGVSQSSQNGVGVSQSSQNGVGVSQSSQNGVGVSQSSQNGVGVSQSSQNGVGVSQLSPNHADAPQSSPNDDDASQSSPNDVNASQSSPNDASASQSSPNDVNASQLSSNGFNGSNSSQNGASASQSSPNDVDAFYATVGRSLAAVWSDSDDDDVRMSDTAADDDEEDIEEPLSTQCLFCDECVLLSAFVAHCRDVHHLDIPALLRGDDGGGGGSGDGISSHWPVPDCQYAFIQLVNYVRTHGVSAEQLVSVSSAEWRCDRYLKPVLANDLLLTIDIDEFIDVDDDDDNDDYDDDDDYEKASLRRTIRQMCEERQRIMGDMEKMRTILCRIMDDDNRHRGKPHRTTSKDHHHHYDHTSSPDSEGGTSCGETVSWKSGDRAYFDTYSDSAIHREMIGDRVRTGSYHLAVKYRPLGGSVGGVVGQRVLDLGCGSGILAMLCARNGAVRVVAVDGSCEAYQLAVDAVHENALEHVVETRHDTVEMLTRADSGCERGFDVIVSEWMGYMLLFEGMLESVLWARDHLLVTGGRLMPDACSMSVCALSDRLRWNEVVGQWCDGSVCDGILLSCLARGALRSASVELVKPETCCSTAEQLISFDLYTCSRDQLQFTRPFALTMLSECVVTALSVFFAVEFSAENVRFDTAPWFEPTHWKQTVLYLPKPRKFAANEIVRGTFFCGRGLDDSRSLRIVVTMDGVSYRYVLS